MKSSLDSLERTQDDEQPTKLPNLIFGEDHDDPTIQIILTKMLNRLQELGYISFYDELPSDNTVDIAIQKLEGVKTWYESLKKITYDQRPSLYKDITEVTYDDLKVIYKDDKEISFILKALPGYTQKLDFMRELIKSNIAYRAIDSTIDSSRRLQTELKARGSAKEMKERNERMAEEYVPDINPVFGLVGANHLNGMKEYLKKSNNFEYFYIYSSHHSGLTGFSLEMHKIFVQRIYQKAFIYLILTRWEKIKFLR